MKTRENPPTLLTKQMRRLQKMSGYADVRLVLNYTGFSAQLMMNDAQQRDALIAECQARGAESVALSEMTDMLARMRERPHMVANGRTAEEALAALIIKAEGGAT